MIWFGAWMICENSNITPGTMCLQCCNFNLLLHWLSLIKGNIG